MLTKIQAPKVHHLILKLLKKGMPIETTCVTEQLKNLY